MLVNSISCVYKTHSNVSVTQTIAGRNLHGTSLIKPYRDYIITLLYTNNYKPNIITSNKCPALMSILGFIGILPLEGERESIKAIFLLYTIVVWVMYVGIYGWSVVGHDVCQKTITDAHSFY